MRGRAGVTETGHPSQLEYRCAKQRNDDDTGENPRVAPRHVQRRLTLFLWDIGAQPCTHPAKGNNQEQEAAQRRAVDKRVLLAGQRQRKRCGGQIEPALVLAGAGLQIAKNRDDQHDRPEQLVDVVAGVTRIMQQGRRKGDERGCEKGAVLAQPAPHEPHHAYDAQAKQRGRYTCRHIAGAEDQIEQRDDVVDERAVVHRAVLIALAGIEVVGEPGMLALVMAGRAVVQRHQPDHRRDDQQRQPGGLFPVPGQQAGEGSVQPGGILGAGQLGRILAVRQDRLLCIAKCFGFGFF